MIARTETTLIERILRRLRYEVRERLRFGRLVKPDLSLTRKRKNPGASLKVALVAIAKNEDHYIQEWIDYHLALEFDEIFVYENDWRAHLSRDDARVHLIPLDGECRQLPAYQDFLMQRSAPFDFAAFIDIDEFIALAEDASIRAFLEKYTGYEAVALNWKLFGDSGLQKVENGDYSLIRRFTHCQKKFNRHVKTIVNLNGDVQSLHFGDPHSVWRETDVTVAVTADWRHKTYSAFNNFPVRSNAWINHYAVKTKQEFLEYKKNRGRADSPRNSRLQKIAMQYFDQYNCNETENLLALRFAASHNVFDTREGVS